MINKDYAIWQYLIDHSTIMGDGCFRIVLTIKGEEDFWRRVKARQEGFKRYDINKKEENQISVKRLLEKYNGYVRYGKRMSNRIKYFEEEGTAVQKILLFIYRKIKKYLFSDL